MTGVSTPTGFDYTITLHPDVNTLGKNFDTYIWRENDGKGEREKGRKGEREKARKGEREKKRKGG